MTFKYFEKPLIYAAMTDGPCTCSICREKEQCFDARTFIPSGALEAVCGTCLAAGRLKEYKISTCTGDSEELKRQLNAHQALKAEQADSLCNEKTAGLESTTPAIKRFKPWLWPSADADYCKFLGYGSVPLYKRLALTTGERLFKDTIYYNQVENSDSDYLWDAEMPLTEINSIEDLYGYDVQFYVFKSINSGKIVSIWDSL